MALPSTLLVALAISAHSVALAMKMRPAGDKPAEIAFKAYLESLDLYKTYNLQNYQQIPKEEVEQSWLDGMQEVKKNKGEYLEENGKPISDFTLAVCDATKQSSDKDIKEIWKNYVKRETNEIQQLLENRVPPLIGSSVKVNDKFWKDEKFLTRLNIKKDREGKRKILEAHEFEVSKVYKDGSVKLKAGSAAKAWMKPVTQYTKFPPEYLAKLQQPTGDDPKEMPQNGEDIEAVVSTKSVALSGLTKQQTTSQSQPKSFNASLENILEQSLDNDLQDSVQERPAEVQGALEEQIRASPRQIAQPLRIAQPHAMSMANRKEREDLEAQKKMALTELEKRSLEKRALTARKLPANVEETKMKILQLAMSQAQEKLNKVIKKEMSFHMRLQQELIMLARQRKQ